ncbi:unnamed protein product [Sphacelaria rigidula]
MLAWAEETDARIARGEIPPLGAGNAASGAASGIGGAPGSQDHVQLSRVSELLSKRRRQGAPLSEDDVSALRCVWWA